jgi:hypothetical protein
MAFTRRCPFIFQDEETISYAKILSSMGWALVGTHRCDYNTVGGEESRKYAVGVWQLNNFYQSLGYDWWSCFSLIFMVWGSYWCTQLYVSVP